jgi:hypothetical protein
MLISFIPLYKCCCGGGAVMSHIILVEMEPKRDAAPAPSPLLNISRIKNFTRSRINMMRLRSTALHLDH